MQGSEMAKGAPSCRPSSQCLLPDVPNGASPQHKSEAELQLISPYSWLRPSAVLLSQPGQAVWGKRGETSLEVFQVAILDTVTLLPNEIITCTHCSWVSAWQNCHSRKP